MHLIQDWANETEETNLSWRFNLHQLLNKERERVEHVSMYVQYYVCISVQTRALCVIQKQARFLIEWQSASLIKVYVTSVYPNNRHWLVYKHHVCVS